MTEVFRYEVIPPSSWAYLSTILMVSLFLKFGRFLSIRNLDIVLLALLAPGLLIVQYGENQRRDIEVGIRYLSRAIQQETNLVKPNDGSLGDEKTATDPEPDDQDSLLKQKLVQLNEDAAHYQSIQFGGYLWLFFTAGGLMTRMLIDPYMIRRPLLEPNLEFSGLTFLTVILLLFLIVNLITANVENEDIIAAESGKDLATATATNPDTQQGPGYRLLALFPVIPTFVADEKPETVSVSHLSKSVDTSLIVVAKVMAIFGQLAVVLGIYLVGYLHFNNTRMGIGIVTLYLLLPYTAEMTGRVMHILPAAALVWAVVCYRKPFWAGIFIGLSMGLAYYPLFLLPLWFSFYWHKGLKDFAIGFVVMIAVLAITLIFTSSDLTHYLQNLRAMFGFWTPIMEGLNGIWEKGNLDPSFRLPIMAAFFCMSISFAVWPAQKNLGTLLSCSAALMIAVQFWHGFGGGLLMAWYLPLALMTMFRPNLEDKTAISLRLEK